MLCFIQINRCLPEQVQWVSAEATAAEAERAADDAGLISRRTSRPFFYVSSSRCFVSSSYACLDWSFIHEASLKIALPIRLFTRKVSILVWLFSSSWGRCRNGLAPSLLYVDSLAIALPLRFFTKKLLKLLWLFSSSRCRCRNLSCPFAFVQGKSRNCLLVSLRRKSRNCIDCSVLHDAGVEISLPLRFFTRRFSQFRSLFTFSRCKTGKISTWPLQTPKLDKINMCL